MYKVFKGLEEKDEFKLWNYQHIVPIENKKNVF